MRLLISRLHYEAHVDLKKHVPGAIGLIRTGDTIQYANMILVSGPVETGTGLGYIIQLYARGFVSMRRRRRFCSNDRHLTCAPKEKTHDWKQELFIRKLAFARPSTVAARACANRSRPDHGDGTARPDFLSANLRYRDGSPVECVIPDTCIGGVAEAAQTARLFSRQGVGLSITVTPCWCYGSETMDMDPQLPKAVWGFNGTERPGAVYLAAVLAAHNQKGLPAFSIYGQDVQDAGDTDHSRLMCRKNYCALPGPAWQ